jgi:glycosyltransferase involved in cell wall biosynthesis
LPGRVVLYAHDLEQGRPTGIGQYADHLISALLGAAGSGSDLDYRVGASPPARRPDDRAVPADLGPVLRPRLGRKTLHLMWSATPWPRADRDLGQPDLIHVLSPYTALRSRAPVVYTVHDTLPLRFPGWYTKKEVFTYRRAMADAVRRAPLLITNSETTSQALADDYGVDPGRTRVVHLGVDRHFFDPVDPAAVTRACAEVGLEPGRYAVAVGTVNSRKNLEAVIEATALLDSDPWPLRLALVGPPGLESDRAVSCAARLGLGDRVRFVGWQPAESVRLLVAGSLALVHPSRYEGFGLTPLEAMASGVPAVVSDAGALPEVTGGAALLASPDDPGEWAAHLDRLRADPALRAELGERGRRHAAGFTWTRAAAETMAVHREILGR